MQLISQEVSRWPKLVWAAVFAPGAQEISVYHGPRVEVAEEWLAEAVWSGDFAAGDFDGTELVFGTGVRRRGEKVVFVSSGTAMDRLWYFQGERVWAVSNSFAALSACAGLSLLEEYPYVDDRKSAYRTTWGDPSCTRPFPTEPAGCHLIWFNNLEYDGASLCEVAKPDTAGRFASYQEYFDFLVAGAKGLQVNLESSARRHKVTPLASISSGYDSPAAAVIARHAGCTEAVTIRQASSLWRGSDAGTVIAERLGMSCREIDRAAQVYPHEIAFWAASGYCNLLNWTLFPFPEPVSLFFTGNYGDAIWVRKRKKKPLRFQVWDDLAMGEARLFQGMLLCPVPYWGMRHSEEIRAITFAEEMEPWTLHSSYDRPLARRMIEEAGIPRGSFAVRKKDTSHEAAFRWPYSPAVQAQFREYLRERGLAAPGRTAVGFIRRLAHLESLFYGNVTRNLVGKKRIQPWRRMSGPAHLYYWANKELRRMYQDALAAAGTVSQESLSEQGTP